MNFEELALLKASHLGRVMTAQAMSTYANQVMAFVIPWMVLTRTGNAINAGIVAFAMGLASFVGILTGGLFIDQAGGRNVSIVADLLSFVTAASLAAALHFDFLPLWFVIVSQVVGVFFDGPGTIAKNTLIPDTARRDSIPLLRAMGLQQTFQNAAMFLGPVSAGLLISIFTEGPTLLSTSCLFLGCAVLVFRLRQPRLVQHGDMTIQKAYQDIQDALQFIIKEPFLGPMQLVGPLFAFILIPIATIVFPAWFVFSGKGSEPLGIFLGSQALGGMIGGFLFAALAPKMSQQKWLVGATAGYALAIACLYWLEPGSSLAAAASFVAGAVSTGIMAIPYTAFYTRTPEHLLGRVNSLGAAAGFLAVSISSIFFGRFIHFHSARSAMGMGILAAGASLIPFMRLLDEKRLPKSSEEI